MFETLQRLFKTGKIDETKLGVAVTKGYITEEQKTEILAQK